jgi:hypothetical protein
LILEIVLDRLGLLRIANKRADTRSGGEAQRVGIGRALAQRPRVLLGDEPVASLDPEAAEDVLQLLQRLAVDEHLGVVCMLHQPELRRACARSGRRHHSRTLCRGGRGPVTTEAPLRTERAFGARAATEAVLPRTSTRDVLLRLTAAMIGAAILGQALIVARFKPQDLVSGVGGMADILRRSFPPDISHLQQALGGLGGVERMAAVLRARIR